MSRPSFCPRCGQLVSPDAPMPRHGVWWLCESCWAVAPKALCADGAHDWGGVVDDHGSPIWGCRKWCGARLQHQAISEKVVEVPKPPEHWDC